MHGWIILDKPSGITSAHAVAKVKRLLLSSPSPLEGEGGVGGISPLAHALIDSPLPNPPPQGGRGKREVKIGHAGTLDPLASGILPLALGEATKTVPYMMDAAKTYLFTVSWGEERDTDDCMGAVVKTSDKRPSRAEIEAVLPRFTGVINQIPPDYSAIKIDGTRAYDAVRSGKALELKAREVTVHSLELCHPRTASETSLIRGSLASARDPRVTDCVRPEDDSMFSCHCSKGTYIRSLARDMGRELGCLGHISALRRVRVGNFDENHAISLEVLAEMVHKGDLSFLRPVESALDDIPACDVSRDQAVRMMRGQTILLPITDGITLIRSEGKLVAIGEASQGSVKPVRVFNI